jgi:hypothetical protein
MSDLATVLAAVRASIEGLEPGALPVETCRAMIDELARTEKVCALARLRVAQRVAGSVRRPGSADGEVAAMLAQSSGGSAAAARAELATVRALEEFPTARAAVEAGELSLSQAREVVAAAKVAPSAEAALVDLACNRGLARVRDEARRVRLGAVSVEDLHREQYRRREAISFTDEWGMVCLRAQLPPEVGVAVANRLERATDRWWRAARRSAGPGARLEPRAAHAADALVAMLGGHPQEDDRAGDGHRVAKAVRREADVVIVADVHAFARGDAEPGEPCHIVGGGPVPVSVARDALEDAFVKLVAHDGVRIREVVHVGRKLPAVLRTALELGAPPRFDGVSCVEEGCDRRLGLEWDHVDPVANGGVTSLDNLEPRCRPCHRAKTERDRAAGLLRAKGPP